MGAGELNRQITIQQKTITRTANGYPQEVWSNLCTAWAQAITTGGGEFYAAQKLNAETSAVFKMRYTQRVNTRQRIKYGNREFEILSVEDPDGKRKYLNIAAKEVAAVGQV